MGSRGKPVGVHCRGKRRAAKALGWSTGEEKRQFFGEETQDVLSCQRLVMRCWLSQG